jgi:SAM-dependent methyltransferase
MDPRSRQDWAAFAPNEIPSKSELPQLERWLDMLQERNVSRVLDIGCGVGTIARKLCARGFWVTGIDINASAIERLQSELPDASWECGDVASSAGLLPLTRGRNFDAAVCQLVVSVVGDIRDRQQLLLNTYEALVPDGHLFISFSGLSDDVNRDYAALYARDHTQTGEYGSYLSRDAEGRVLYRTHHFGLQEIAALLETAGFRDLQIDTQLEVSSRRHDQQARFHYVSCRRS